MNGKEHIINNLKTIEPALRKARCQAARKYVKFTSCWWAILSGSWDGGNVVSEFITR